MKTDHKRKSYSKKSISTQQSNISVLPSIQLIDSISFINPNSEYTQQLDLRFFVIAIVPKTDKLDLPKILPNLKMHLRDFLKLAVTKYLKGQLEHGGNFEDVDHLKEAKNEVVDQWMYLNQLEFNQKI